MILESVLQPVSNTPIVLAAIDYIFYDKIKL